MHSGRRDCVHSGHLFANSVRHIYLRNIKYLKFEIYQLNFDSDSIASQNVPDLTQHFFTFFGGLIKAIIDLFSAFRLRQRFRSKAI